MIAIVDYGMGNLRSVQKGFERVGASAEVVTAPDPFACSEECYGTGQIDPYCRQNVTCYGFRSAKC